MEKRKTYLNTKFSPRLIAQAIDKFNEIAGTSERDYQYFYCSLKDESWILENIDEFISSYIKDDCTSYCMELKWDNENTRFNYESFSGETIIKVRNPSRASIESIFSIFEHASPDDRTVISPTDDAAAPTIFIGHGRSSQWSKLKSHLQDKHKLDVICYESGARAGHTIRDILDSMSKQSSFALLVLTGEDRTQDGVRARQNVIHECGLFQGRLGFDRAILLVEQGVELASNFDGIQQLRFKKGRISEVYGDVIATLRREFGPL